MYRNLIFLRDALLDKLHARDGNDYDPVIVDKERKDAKRELDHLLNERDSLLEQISTHIHALYLLFLTL